MDGPLQVSALLRTGGGPWSEALLLFNAGETPLTLPLPPGEWEVLADGESSFRWQTPVRAAAATAESHTALLLGRRT